MKLFYLSLVFLAVVIVLLFHRPLYQAVLCGIAVCCILFHIPLLETLRLIFNVFSGSSNLSVLVSLYLIMLLQQILEERNQIRLAQKDLDSLFHNRRINASVAPIFIGLLPHAGAMILCSDIVKEASDGYLDPEEQAFVTSWFRHIPESTLPTYTGVLLMSTLSGIPLNEFMPLMIIPVIALFSIGYFLYLRKLPGKYDSSDNNHKLYCLLQLFKHLWSLLLVLILILFFNLSVPVSLLIVIFLSLLLYRFSFNEILVCIKQAFSIKLLLNSLLVLILKEFVGYTQVLQLLPSILDSLPIPSYLVFALLFFLGGLISGTSAAIGLGAPLAFASADANVYLMVLLICMTHAASQLSPIHVCLSVASDYYQIPLTSLIRKSIFPALLFCLLMILYYNLLLLI